MYWDGHGWAAPQGPPAATATATATKKSSTTGKVVLMFVGTLVLLFAIGKCESGDSTSSSSSSSPSSRTSTASAAPAATPSARPTPTAAPAGSAVRDGKFEFQVLGVERSTSKEGIFNPEQAKLYLFLDARRASSVNGILGVQPDPVSGKVKFTGDLDLRLRNALRHRLGLFAGELPYQGNAAVAGAGARNIFGFGTLNPAS